MNSRIEEGSEALVNRNHFPSRLGEKELEALKRAIATIMDFPVLEDNSFDRTSEDWITMEECLSGCYIAVFHRYKAERLDKEVTAIFILSPHAPDEFQVWIAEADDLSDLKTVDQALSMQEE